MNVDELGKPLDRSRVLSRKQGKAQVSYIEAWWAISEANRVFDYDGWSRETIEMKCVSERERKIGKGDWEKDGWGVSYVAKVRITVMVEGRDVIKEGTGAGHGIDVDPGQAHESAVKEAESDAMKRALMMFGSIFGLALYDKTQANVEDAGEREARERFERHVAEKIAIIATIERMDEFVAFWKGLDHAIRVDPRVIGAKDARKAEIEAASQARAAELKDSKA